MLKALEPLLYTLESNEYFDRKGFVNRLYDLIKVSIRPPFSLYLDGKEGTGKTSVMKKLYDKLKIEGYPVVWFNPWQYSGKKDLSLIFAQKLTMLHKDALFSKGVECHWRMLPLLLKEGVDMGGRALEKGICPPRRVVGKDKKYKESRSLVKRGLRDTTRQLQVEFFQLVDHISEGNGHKSVIFFFDDLDRLRSVELVKLLNALKNIFISAHLNAIFVCAMDSQSAIKSLSHACFDDVKQDAADYLSKIFDLSFQLPPFILEDAFFVQRVKTLYGWDGAKEDWASKLVRMIRSYGSQTPLEGMGYVHRMISQFHAFLLFNPEYRFCPENDVMVNLLLLKDASRHTFDQLVDVARDKSFNALAVCHHIIEKDSECSQSEAWQKNYLLKYYGKEAPFSGFTLSGLLHGDFVLV